MLCNTTTVPLAPFKAEDLHPYRIPVDTVLPVQQARTHDQASMQVEKKPNTFRVPVCVLCDRLIIGCETAHKITTEQLLSQGSRISVRSYEDHHQVVLKEDLVSQYHINGFDGLLLSPRARSYSSKDGQRMYDACSQCATAWANKKCDSPPKHSIANGFAIGMCLTVSFQTRRKSQRKCVHFCPPCVHLHTYLHTLQGLTKAYEVTLASSK